MTRSSLSRSSHAQRSSMRDVRARSPRNRSIRARSPHGRSTSRGRSPIHHSSIRSYSPGRRRLAGRTALSNRLSRPSGGGGGNALRGGGRGNQGLMMARRRNKRTKWRQNKKKRRRGRGMGGRNGQRQQNNAAARLRMDDYMPPRTSRGHASHKEVDIDRAVARARREASTRTKDVFWTKKLLDAEQQNHPRSTTTSRRRWVHSGFKEMYKEELGYSEAEQSDRRQSGDKRRGDGKLRRDVSSLDRRSPPLHSKRKSSRSPMRRGHKKSKSPPGIKSSLRSPRKADSSRLRRRSRSPSSNSSISSSSSFSGSSLSSYSRSSSGSSGSGTSSVSSLSFPRRKKRSRSPSPRVPPPKHRIPRSNPPAHASPKAPPPPQPKVTTSKGIIGKLRTERAALSPPADCAHYGGRSPGPPRPAVRLNTAEQPGRRPPPPDSQLISQKFTFSQPACEDTDSDSSSVNDGPHTMSLSERFGKLAQLSSQRQEYEGIRMKIVRQGGQDKRVYLEGRPALPATRPASPRSKPPPSRSKGGAPHEKWLREHKAEYDDYEKRYGEFRQWDPHRDLPRDLPLKWDDVNVRYRFYNESGYFGDRNITMEDYLKWEEWWYQYRDWLEKYGGREHSERDSRDAYESAGRVSSTLWFRDKDDRKRRRY